MSDPISAPSSRKSLLSRLFSRKPLAAGLAIGAGLLLSVSYRGQAAPDSMGGYSIEVSAGPLTGYFDSISDLGSESEVLDQAANPKVIGTVATKIQGKLKVGEVVLKRGVTRNMDMFQWRKQVEEGRLDQAKLDTTVILYDATMVPVAQWVLIKAWPKSLKVKAGAVPDGEDSAANSGGSVEKLVLATDRIVRVR